MRNIEEIAWDLCELYYKTKPPIDENGNVIYYMAGSLATLPFICADSMQEIMIDNGKIIGMGSAYDIPIEAKNNFYQFRRQINDTDYVYVSGEPSKSFIYNLYDIIPDFDKISPKGKSVLLKAWKIYSNRCCSCVGNRNNPCDGRTCPIIIVAY